MRVDAFVAWCYPHFSRVYVQHLCAQKAVFLNGRPVLKSMRVCEGDVCAVLASHVWHPDEVPLANFEVPLQVLWEDAHVLAVHKPAGMPTHPLKHDETHTLCNALVAYNPSLRGVGYAPFQPGVLHRLDTETSGVVLVAKTQDVFHALQNSFQKHQVAKHYRAVVYGAWQGHHKVCADLEPYGHKGFKMRHVLKQDTPAFTHTDIQVTFSTEHHAWVDVLIHQGVRHQIRAHLALNGHPIVGDLLYAHADEEAHRPFPRHLLHASRVVWPHPVLGGWMETSSEAEPFFSDGYALPNP